MKPEREAFRRAAADQGRCQAPGCIDPYEPWDPHHVVSRQELKRRGLAQWDTRNVLRLGRLCHFNHEFSPNLRLPVRVLTDANIAYAFEVLGAYAYDYLRRHYTGEDSRVAVHLARVEAAAA